MAAVCAPRLAAISNTPHGEYSSHPRDRGSVNWLFLLSRPKYLCSERSEGERRRSISSAVVMKATGIVGQGLKCHCQRILPQRAAIRPVSSKLTHQQRCFRLSPCSQATEVPNQPPQTKLAETRLRRFWRLVSVDKADGLPTPHPPQLPKFLCSRWLQDIPRLETAADTAGKHDRLTSAPVDASLPHRRRMERRDYRLCQTAYSAPYKSCLQGNRSTYAGCVEGCPCFSNWWVIAVPWHGCHFILCAWGTGPWRFIEDANGGMDAAYSMGERDLGRWYPFEERGVGDWAIWEATSQNARELSAVDGEVSSQHTHTHSKDTKLIWL